MTETIVIDSDYIRILMYWMEGGQLDEMRNDELEMELACMRSVGMDHEEVGFMRVQSRPPGPPERRTWRHELIVGETRGKGTVFQDPLIRFNQAMVGGSVWGRVIDGNAIPPM
ncbi:hypothetical protein O3M35_011461 [Rhynocoris fuscipes]|uniref:Uncharacterized protein n=1 Tax=Rhynocoris fuscipes TaxID=488301 RepID=A0AAW1CWC3_9HEMI